MRLAANVKMIQDIAPFNFKFIMFGNGFNNWVQFGTVHIIFDYHFVDTNKMVN